MIRSALRPSFSPFTWLRRVADECYVFSPVLYAVLMVHGGFFFRAGSPFEQHFLAFPGVRELYIGVCCLAAVLAIIEGLRRGRFFSGDLILIFVVASFAVGSAALAYLKFGQPIIYGVFEERRVLMFFGLFAMLAAYYQFDDRPEALIGAIYWTALSYLVLGLAMQAGVLGDLASRDIPYFDPRKHRILVGTDLYAASLMIATVMVSRFKVWEHLVPALVGAAGLLLISQTRSTMVVVIAAMVLFFATTALWRFLAVAAVGLMGFIALFLQASATRDQNYDVSVAEIDVRLHTAGRILDELSRNDWIGMGALSLQWQNGFHRIYGDHFYLSDVGIVGEFYRFGIFLPIIFGIMALGVYCYLRQPMDARGRSLCLGLLLLLILNSPGGGIIAFAGANWALLIAIAVAFREPTGLPQTMGTPVAIRI